eukprot:966819-Amphidinium_carterae.1
MSKESLHFHPLFRGCNVETVIQRRCPHCARVFTALESRPDESSGLRLQVLGLVSSALVLNSHGDSCDKVQLNPKSTPQDGRALLQQCELVDAFLLLFPRTGTPPIPSLCQTNMPASLWVFSCLQEFEGQRQYRSLTILQEHQGQRQCLAIVFSTF